MKPMKKAVLYLFLIPGVNSFAQENQPVTFPKHLQATEIADLKANDSLIYFQCYVAEATQELTLASGEKMKGNSQKYTVTEKFVVIRDKDNYRLKYFTSSLTDYPNKKFAYLKMLEKKYWNFRLVKDTVINEHDVLMFAAMERKAHDTTEYEFKVTSQNNNELIINGRKVSKQLLVEGDYKLRRNLEVLQ
jgi:hypothetical protein